MKTNLTLVKSAFYFLKSINLIKGITQPVDLSILTDSELKGLKNQVSYGFITSDVDISDYKSEVEEVVVNLAPVESEVTALTVEASEPETMEQVETVLEIKSEPKTITEPYEGWLKSRVRKELTKRKIVHSNDSLKDDLVLLLLEYDEKSSS